MLEKINKFVMKTIEIIVGILISLMVIIVFSNVVGRYFLHASVSWSEEVSRFMMIWLVFLGSVLAYIKNEHLGLDLVVESVPKKVGKIILVVANVLVIAALLLIIKGGYSLVRENMTWLSPGASISYGFVYSIVPVCGIILLIQTIFKLLMNIKAVASKEDKLC
jgi:TRAP-type transport system small permease protein